MPWIIQRRATEFNCVLLQQCSPVLALCSELFAGQRHVSSASALHVALTLVAVELALAWPALMSSDVNKQHDETQTNILCSTLMEGRAEVSPLDVVRSSRLPASG